MTFPPDYPYEVGDEIARGGMGAVMAARDTLLDREVALKVALPRMMSSDDAIRRFQQEARILARLDHPNIVPVHDLGVTDEGLPFYTMKRVRGRTLHQILRAVGDGDEETLREYPLSALLTVFQKICDAVGYAHSQGIIHRDLKPENIMIGEFGEVLVMDWGLAKSLRDSFQFSVSSVQSEDGEGTGQSSELFESDSALTMDGQIMGTPQFMAPEQAEGRIDEQDERTDIFALGAILYSTLTLRAPTMGTTVGEILDDVRAGYIPPPVYYNRIKGSGDDVDGGLDSHPISLSHCPKQEIPEALSLVTMAAMAFDREERYASVEDLKAEIAAWQSGQVTAAEEAGPIRKLAALLNRHRAIAVAAGAAMIVALVLTGALILSEREAQQAFEDLRESAPVFRDVALSLRNEGKLDEALVQLEAGIQLQPDNAEFQLIKGHLLQAGLRLNEAGQAYKRALSLDASLHLAETNAALCEAVASKASGNGELPAELIDELRHAAVMQDRPMDGLILAERIEKPTPVYEKRWQEAFNTTGIKGTMNKAGVGFQIHGTHPYAVPSFDTLKGFPLTDLSLNAKSDDISALAGMPLRYYNGPGTDLSPLRGSPLEHFVTGHSELADLSPLQGMPLKVFNAPDTHISDLNPLRGAPLEHLEIGATRIFDLEPLRGMKLKFMRIEQTKIRALSPLKGMPLEYLSAYNTRVSDLSPLREMPLGTLLLGKTEVTDLSPLQGMKLAELHIDGTEVTDLAPIAGMPLRQLGMRSSSVGSLAPLASLAQLRKLEAGNTKITDLSPLSALQLDYLSLQDTQVSDLEPLKGQLLKNLYLRGCPVSEISPLEGLPLTWLELQETFVEDIGSLAGTPLEVLLLSGTRVSDLSPLADSPVRVLSLDECRNLKDLKPLAGLPKLETINLRGSGVTDVSPLADCAKLLSVVLPELASRRGVEKLRDHPTLKVITFRAPASGVNPTTAEEFWKAWDKGERK